VVPNLYPVVGDGVPGAHEVVVLSPEHDRSFAGLTDDAAAAVFDVLRERSAAHLAAGLEYAQPFVNHGKAAGASIEHPHAQLVVLGFTPPAAAAVVARFAAAGRDLVADAMREALDGAHGVLAGDAPAWCPPASRTPYEVLVAHPDAGPRFDLAPGEVLAPVAHATRRALVALTNVLGEVPYNVVVHGAPAGVTRDHHWYVRITPRVSVTAGFEDGTGVYVNTVPPERAAAELREAAP
jgi:UDPglucose--hexose-1-phosphate uridylyltransferase